MVHADILDSGAGINPHGGDVGFAEFENGVKVYHGRHPTSRRRKSFTTLHMRLTSAIGHPLSPLRRA
jgi:hypothetical protein